jgi:hypothetical protein
MAGMTKWNYLHRIEYVRVVKGERIHERTELVEDAGFCYTRNGMTREQWLVYYTKACAEDYLLRTGLATGIWLVTVYQQRPEDENRLLCSIRTRWTGRIEPAANGLADGA